jgi:hypothetical protein
VRPVEIDSTEGLQRRAHLVIHRTYMGSPL